MRFVIWCRDRPGALQIRLDTRSAHLAYLDTTGVVEMAGPLIENGEMCGSLLVIGVDTLQAAQDWAAGDPYAKAGLFDSVTISEWKKVIG